jgi:glycosyltransferase involved in cell wall biosynthesis
MSPTQQTLFINGRFLEQPVTGVQRYSREVLRALDGLLASEQIDRERYQLVCLASCAARDLPNWKWIRVETVGRRTGNLWEQLDLPWAARGRLCFSPANVGPYFLTGQVVTVHDASVFAVPRAYSLPFRWKHRILFRRLGQTARTILTDSEFSKRELVRWCGISAAKIRVIPLGREHILRAPADSTVFERLRIGSRPYFLCVGSNSPHKNFSVVLEALARLERKDFEVIIAGGDFARVFQAQDHALPENARRVGYLQDAELRALYQRSVGFIFPSLYEGFGLPPLEAMTCGCPVVCSNASALPEVGGDAVRYFDPADAGELADQMEQLAADSVLQAALRAKGARQAERFSWEKTAQATWQALCPA